MASTILRPTDKPFELAPEHDGRHQLNNNEHARESLVYMVQLPEHDIAAFIYTWVSGDGKAGAALSVYGKAVGEPIFEGCDGLPASDDMTFDDWSVGAVHVCLGEPLKIADVSYRGDKASIDYHFEAMHPAYNYGSCPEGCPPWMAHDRFEQSGRIKGVLTIGDKKYPFDTFGHRDHSWGTRDWGQVQQSKWLECQAEPDIAINLFHYAAVQRQGFMGYVQKDGQIAEVANTTIDFRLDENQYHEWMKFVIVDTLGRTTEVECKVFALFEFPVSPLYTLNEASMITIIDGHPAIGHVEMGWPREYLNYIRSAKN